jgi:hypothetical protein
MESIIMIYITALCIFVMSCSHAFECWLMEKSLVEFFKTLPVAWIFGSALAGAIIFLYRNVN